MGTSSDQLRADIEATRAQLTHDLGRLADRVQPAQVMRRRKQRLRIAAAKMRQRVSRRG
ncbi:DUF3618 domain-containing protein [Streptomyces hoynatensis]|uniref:DUF3618 domain-containing protein n=1 Tax=Streptomyces hoynatensis TaxID=1141874 RepID=A0A3A9ZFP0_9ACTN|nr:DUF3618 domain-containing protein [Streptomyces hoynatensis]RKN47158.1 DUF3618 domain-containing protein [Streptomyces hoynatensis]